MNIGDLAPLAIGLVVGGLVLTYGADIATDVNNDYAAGTAAANTSRDTLGGMTSLASKLPSVGTIAAAAIIVGLLVSAFAFRSSQN